jgi:hypothetical protein
VQAVTNVERIDQIITEIKASLERPGIRPMTSQQLKHRADQRRQIATGLKMKGDRVKPEYE